jgi:hypothetical protein
MRLFLVGRKAEKQNVPNAIKLSRKSLLSAVLWPYFA